MGDFKGKGEGGNSGLKEADRENHPINKRISVQRNGSRGVEEKSRGGQRSRSQGGKRRRKEGFGGKEKDR